MVKKRSLYMNLYIWLYDMVQTLNACNEKSLSYSPINYQVMCKERLILSYIITNLERFIKYMYYFSAWQLMDFL